MHVIRAHFLSEEDWLHILRSSLLFFWHIYSSLGFFFVRFHFSLLKALISAFSHLLLLSFRTSSLFCVQPIFSAHCPSSFQFVCTLDTWYWAITSGSSPRHLVNSERGNEYAKGHVLQKHLSLVPVTRSTKQAQPARPATSGSHLPLCTEHKAICYLSAPLEAPAFERKESDFLAKCDPKDHPPPSPHHLKTKQNKNPRASWAIRDTSCFPLLKASWIDETEGSKGLSASGAWGLAEWLLTLCCLLLWVAQAVCVFYFLGRYNILRARVSLVIHLSNITIPYQMPSFAWASGGPGPNTTQSLASFI